MAGTRRQPSPAHPGSSSLRRKSPCRWRHQRGMQNRRLLASQRSRGGGRWGSCRTAREGARGRPGAQVCGARPLMWPVCDAAGQRLGRMQGAPSGTRSGRRPCKTNTTPATSQCVWHCTALHGCEAATHACVMPRLRQLRSLRPLIAQGTTHSGTGCRPRSPLRTARLASAPIFRHTAHSVSGQGCIAGSRRHSSPCRRQSPGMVLRRRRRRLRAASRCSQGRVRMGGATVLEHASSAFSPAAASARPRTSTAATRAIGGATPCCRKRYKVVQRNYHVLHHNS